MHEKRVWYGIICRLFFRFFRCYQDPNLIVYLGRVLLLNVYMMYALDRRPQENLNALRVITISDLPDVNHKIKMTHPILIFQNTFPDLLSKY